MPPSRTALTRLLRIATALACVFGIVAVAPQLHEWAHPPVLTCPDTAIGAALVLEVRDAQTRAPLAAVRGGARLEIRDSLGARSLFFPWQFEGPYWLAGHGRPGRYSAQVTVAGYASWDTTAIVVPSAPCGLVGQKLTVQLQPAR